MPARGGVGMGGVGFRFAVGDVVKRLPEQGRYLFRWGVTQSVELNQVAADHRADRERTDEAGAQDGVVVGQMLGGLALLGDHRGADFVGGVHVREH